MNQLGSVGLVTALAFAAYAVVAGVVGGKLRSLRVVRSAERATLAFFVMATVAVFALEYLILTDDFHNAYVAEHSNRDLLTFYKVAALWAGQEGSLLFWTWLLSIYSALVVLLNRKKNRQLMPYVVAVLMGTGVFFSSLVLFCQPFSRAIARLARWGATLHPAGWQWAESSFAIPLHGYSPSHALPGVCRYGGPLRFRDGGPHHAAIG